MVDTEISIFEVEIIISIILITNYSFFFFYFLKIYWSGDICDVMGMLQLFYIFLCNVTVVF